MKDRSRAWILIAAVALLCGLAIWTASWLRSRSALTLAGLMRRLPPESSAVLYLDFRAMRESGVLALLSGSKVDVEPEYRSFVEETGFDYRQDLDTALVSFHPKAVFLLLRGRFDWKNLRTYAAAHGGVCRNTLCRMQGSTPQRNISFFPVRSDLMALAVSEDAWAVTHLQRLRSAPGVPVPSQPVWLYLTASALQKAEDFPLGTQLFVKALQGAESVTLAVGAQGERLEATMDVACRSERDAETLQGQFEGITSVLKAIIASEKQKPNPKDLSGVLTAGVFSRQNRRVIGRWPLDRAFLGALAGSS
jgi:hypothetical protein